MPLSAERRKQLDGIVTNLASQNAPQEDVQAIVNDFSGKYGNETAKKVVKATGNRENFLDRALDAVQPAGKFINNLSGLSTLSEGLGDVLSGQGTNVTPQQALGSGAQGIASIASLAVNPADSWQGRAAQAGAFGAASSAGKSIENATKLPQAALNAASAGLTGAAISAAVEGVGNLLQSGAKKIYNVLVPTPTKQIQAGQGQIGEGLLERNVRGGYGRMQDTVGDIANKAGGAQQGVLADNVDKSVDLTDTIDSLNTLRDQLANTPGSSTAGVDSVLKDLKSSLPLADAQTLKQNLQSAVKSSGFISENVVGTKQAQKTAAQGVRKAIESTVPDIANPNAELTFAKRATDAISAATNRKPNVLRNAAELGLAGGGYFLNPLIAAGVGAERAVTTVPAVGTRVGSAAYKAGQKALDPAVQAILGRLIGQLVGRNQ